MKVGKRVEGRKCRRRREVSGGRTGWDEEAKEKEVWSMSKVHVHTRWRKLGDKQQRSREQGATKRGMKQIHHPFRG